MSVWTVIAKKNKALTTIAMLIVFFVSGLSAWRFLAILDLNSTNWMIGAGLWVASTLGFILFWSVVLYLIFNRITSRRLLVTIAGTSIFGLLGLLLATPAGLSRITLEIYAQDVWSPNIFTVTWGDAGGGLPWQVPLSLPMGQAMPVTLEIMAIEPDSQSPAGEVWLVGAVWPDGSTIPLIEFQAGNGWQRREVNWGSYRNQPIWVFAQGGQPVPLRWEGIAPGSLTLIFAKHDQAGQVAIRWNGVEQTVDLYNPQVTFQGITLPTNEPVVWRADLPVSALAHQINISVEPDPGGGFPAIIQTLAISGIPGRMQQEATGERLLDTLGVTGNSQVVLTGNGVQLIPKRTDRPFQTFLNDPPLTRLKWSTMIPRLENLLLILYLMMVGGILSINLVRWLPANFLTNAGIVAISIIAALLIGEVALSIYLPLPRHYYPRPPYLHRIFKPYPGVLPGIAGESHFITNSQGIRGDEFSDEDDYQILTIGGSTTECLFLDQTETWPQLLQDMLNDNEHNRRVWVGNAGQSARTTRAYVMHMKYLLPQYPSLDAVILLAGINDLSLRLSQGDDYTPNYLTSPAAEQALIQRAFYLLVQQDPYLPYYQQSATWRLVDKLKQSRIAQAQTVAAIDIEDEAGIGYIRRRSQRKNGLIRQTLPDLSTALEEYSHNLNTIVDIAQAHKVRLILMTQPTMWRSDLTQAEKDLLWFGHGPRREFFYSIEALMEGMAAYNKQLLEVCRQRQVECIDLTPALPKDTTIFYDDVHFNENGARQVARIVADYMRQHPPFSDDF